jgi:hypothetical protein
VSFLISFELFLILYRHVESRRDTIESTRIQFITQLHQPSKGIFVTEAAHRRVSVANNVGVEQFSEQVFFLEVGMDPV